MHLKVKYLYHIRSIAGIASNNLSCSQNHGPVLTFAMELSFLTTTRRMNIRWLWSPSNPQICPKLSNDTHTQSGACTWYTVHPYSAFSTKALTCSSARLPEREAASSTSPSLLVTQAFLFRSCHRFFERAADKGPDSLGWWKGYRGKLNGIVNQRRAHETHPANEA